jgi:hypothetical protein
VKRISDARLTRVEPGKGIIAADPAAQQAEQQLQAAAAPFSTNTEDLLEPMPDLMKRFSTAAGKLRELADFVPRTTVHGQLLARMKLFLDAHDAKDGRAARKRVSELEDIVALALGDKEVQEFAEEREKLEAKLKEAAGNAEALEQIQAALKTRTDALALKLAGFVK